MEGLCVGRSEKCNWCHVTLKLSDAPVSTQFLRVLMTESSNTCDLHGADDIPTVSDTRFSPSLPERSIRPVSLPMSRWKPPELTSPPSVPLRLIPGTPLPMCAMTASISTLASTLRVAVLYQRHYEQSACDDSRHNALRNA